MKKGDDFMAPPGSKFHGHGAGFNNNQGQLPTLMVSTVAKQFLDDAITALYARYSMTADGTIPRQNIFHFTQKYLCFYKKLSAEFAKQYQNAQPTLQNYSQNDAQYVALSDAEVQICISIISTYWENGGQIEQPRTTDQIITNLVSSYLEAHKLIAQYTAGNVITFGLPDYGYPR